MIERHVLDWDGAYANGANIAGSDRWPAAWSEPAKAYRAALEAEGRARLDISYGTGARNALDIFMPTAAPRGLVVFIHGGYWMAFDKSTWSHLAEGAVASGYAVAMPSYTLCPEARISGIVAEIGAAVEKAATMIEGPIVLTGHSAGGHLASRMVTATTPLSPAVAQRVRHVVSISGLHDLRPLMRTCMNATLCIDDAEALSQSPALLMPMEGARITCWAGGSERAEFLRQNALLANIWTGLGATTCAVVEPDRHHFSIVDGLAEAAHPLTRCLLAE